MNVEQTNITLKDSLYLCVIAASAILASRHFILEELVARPFIIYLLLVIAYYRSYPEARSVMASPPVVAFGVFTAYFLARVPWIDLDTKGEKDVFYTVICGVLLVGMAVSFGKRKLPPHFLLFLAATGLLYVMYYLLLGVETSNPLIYGYTLFSFLPLLILEIEGEPRHGLKKVTIVIILSTAVVLLLLFSTRVPAVSLLIFGAVMHFWDTITKSPGRMKLLFALLFVCLLGGILLYVQLWYTGVLADFDTVSDRYFQKGISGRGSIWPELLLRILDDPFFGHGSTRNTEYYDNFTGVRNLSSHNTYLEISFRMGLVGLFLLILVYYKLIMHFCRHREVPAAKVGGAYVLAAMVFQGSGEYMFFNSILANVLVWSFLGVCIGRTLLPEPPGQPR
ncbi:O-antigen ligase family protein [Geomonas terrae]|nr:O-antigen ligase family protein [Geomonas terrae]